jgi:ligand-binding SRPBCC domain-containing protein
MPLTICPAVRIAAPIETVWDIIITPARYGEWLDVTTERIEPEGPLCPGQTVVLSTREFGRTWHITWHVEAVDEAKHSIDIYINLPLGMINQEHMSFTRVDATITYVQFG